MAELTAPRERICATCIYYSFKTGNAGEWRWTCCLKRKFWFPDKEAKPGDLKACEEWE